MFHNGRSRLFASFRVTSLVHLAEDLLCSCNFGPVTVLDRAGNGLSHELDGLAVEVTGIRSIPSGKRAVTEVSVASHVANVVPPRVKVASW
jgi:hypothetical protein